MTECGARDRPGDRRSSLSHASSRSGGISASVCHTAKLCIAVPGRARWLASTLKSNRARRALHRTSADSPAVCSPPLKGHPWFFGGGEGVPVRSAACDKRVRRLANPCAWRGRLLRSPAGILRGCDRQARSLAITAAVADRAWANPSRRPSPPNPPAPARASRPTARSRRRCSSGPVTSPSAVSKAPSRRPHCSTAFPARCSPPATTST